MLTKTGTHRPRTIKEVAAELGQHPETVRRKVQRGEIPAVRLGGPRSAIRIDPLQLSDWLYGPREAA